MYAILAPIPSDGDLSLARMAYERQYSRDWMWCEATTLHEVDALQKRLVNQEMFEAEKRVQLNTFRREQCYKQTGDRLRAQMVSSSTSEWEKDFIRKYFALRDNKRDAYRDALTHRNMYIFAREQSDSKNVEDLLPMQEGQFERAGV